MSGGASLGDRDGPVAMRRKPKPPRPLTRLKYYTILFLAGNLMNEEYKQLRDTRSP